MGNLEIELIKMICFFHIQLYLGSASCKYMQFYSSEIGNLQIKPIKWIVFAHSVVFGVSQLQIHATLFI